VELLWIGSVGGMEQALVERAGIRFQGINTGQLRGVNPLQRWAILARCSRGFAKVWPFCETLPPMSVW